METFNKLINETIFLKSLKDKELIYYYRSINNSINKLNCNLNINPENSFNIRELEESEKFKNLLIEEIKNRKLKV